MLGNRKELEQLLIDDIKLIRRKKNVVADIKTHLAQNHDIMAGDVQEWLNEPEEKLGYLDIRELYLFTQQLFLKTGDQMINPEKYFTPVEIKEGKLFKASIKRETIELPLTLENATIYNSGSGTTYTVPMSIKLLDELLENQLLIYDPELQRGLETKIDKNGNIRQEPILNTKNVDEIADKIEDGTLVTTTIVWNALLGSSDDAEEIVFDPRKRTVTITKGTQLAIVDGFHRHKGSQKALRRNPDLNFEFILEITNYDKFQAQQYQAQLAKATPISESRRIQLQAERYADSIVSRLKRESDLKNRIVDESHHIKTRAGHLVAYPILANTIDSQFNIVSKREAKKVGDFLIDFFDELIGSFPEQFIFDIKKTREKSLINVNNMFAGYVALASRMYKENIPVDDLVNIINSIDFSRNNPMWRELGILDENGNYNDKQKNVIKTIVKYFNDLELGEMVG